MISLQERYEELAKTYPAQMRPSLVVPLLQYVQERQGYVTPEDAHAVARCVGVPQTQVLEALSWYSMLQREPIGRHVIKVCHNIACSLRGAERLVDHLERKLGIRAGETTSDGRFTLQRVECLASCGAAPSLQINDTHHDRVSEASIDRMLDDLA